MTLLLSFEFLLRDGSMSRGATLYTKYIREGEQPHFPRSDIRCDLEHVELITTSDDRFQPKVFWNNEIFGPEGRIDPMLDDRDGEPLDLALINIREDNDDFTWILRSEPTIDGRIGVTISNSRKPLFVGIGDITEVEFTPLREGLPSKSGHIFTFTFHEIYSWRHGSPIGSAHTSGADRVSSPSVQPDYGVPDGGVDNRP
jgi:hypothetical protein